MKGKEKCKALKEIRRKIAEQNDITFAVSECTYQGDCKGTCPKCEAELRYLERELAIRKNLGKAVVVAGISAGICAPMTACNPIDAIGNVINDVYYMVNPEVLEGDVEIREPISEEMDGGLEETDPVSEEVDVDIEETDPTSEDIMGMEGVNPDMEYNPGTDPETSEETEELLMGEVLEGDIMINSEASYEE